MTWVKFIGDDGEGSGTDDQTAAEVPNTPAGNIAATNVQTALNELDTEKQSAITFGSGAQTPLASAPNASGGYLVYGNAAVLASPLTGFSASAGTVAGTDTTMFTKLPNRFNQ